MPNARPLPLLVAIALAAAAPRAATAQDNDMERCYGVARAGQADGVEEPGRLDSGTVDYQGDAWMWVPRGTCLTTPLPPRPDGTPRRGSLQPLERDPADG